MDKKFWILLGVMIVLSPLFAYAAEIVGYSEPLENVAEMVGAEEKPFYDGLLPDYTVPGIDPYTGTLISGLIGTLITLGVAYGLAKVASNKRL
jgi:hypothetical protein